MKTLLVLRHAKSSWSNAYLSDHERPLNSRGKNDAPRMGRLLLAEDLTPDLIITSSAERALTTAELVALNCDFEHEIVVTRQLYHADSEGIVEVLRDLGGDHHRVMVIGHNPGMEDFVEDMTGEYVGLPTAALVCLEYEIASWQELTMATEAKIKQVWRPKELQD